MLSSYEYRILKKLLEGKKPKNLGLGAFASVKPEEGNQKYKEVEALRLWLESGIKLHFAHFGLDSLKAKDYIDENFRVTASGAVAYDSYTRELLSNIFQNSIPLILSTISTVLSIFATIVALSNNPR